MYFSSFTKQHIETEGKCLINGDLLMAAHKAELFPECDVLYTSVSHGKCDHTQLIQFK